MEKTNSAEGRTRFAVLTRGIQCQEAAEQEANSHRNVHKWAAQRRKYIGVQVWNVIQRSLDERPHIEKEVKESFWEKSG